VETRALFIVIPGLLIGCAHAKSGETPAAQPPVEARADESSVERMRTAEAEMPGKGPVATRPGEREREREARETEQDLEEESADVPTALQQGNDEVDLDLTARIRKQLMDDDSLSFAAKNVRVITKDGLVTLRGQVNNQSERRAVYKKAVAEAGPGRVSDHLETRNQE
jgi:hypothetical protein